MHVILLQRWVKCPEDAWGNGYTIVINRDAMLTSNFKSSNEFGNNFIVSQIVAEDVSPLKVELLWEKPSEFRMRVSSIPIERSILKELVDRFHDKVKISISLSHPHQLTLSVQGMEIDRENYIIYSKKESIDFRRFESISMHMCITAEIPDDVIPNVLRLDSEQKPAFRQILEEGTLSDLTIITKDRAEIRCHKLLLCAYSPVLKAMFESGLEESKTGRLNMSDTTERVVQAFLRYLYYDDMKWSEVGIEVTFGLLCIANKYIVPRLELQIIKFLVEMEEKSISVKIAFKMYKFVRNIKVAFLLKRKLVNILKRNVDELETLPKYKEFLQNPENSMELCKNFAKGY